MSTERCAKLMAVGMANNLDETWISENPSLVITYISQYFPNFYRWYVFAYGLIRYIWTIGGREGRAHRSLGRMRKIFKYLGAQNK